MFAMAVNEENAAGGRVVTAPTNGAAGIIPAVAHYYTRFRPRRPGRRYLSLLADGGSDRHPLQGECLYLRRGSRLPGRGGRGCSWPPAGWSRRSTVECQIEHAAEIGMEHNLGMTCDPIGGLVQIPCIERNAMGAVKAINACRIAMRETDEHKVSLDQVIATMYHTGLDMQSRYKETSSRRPGAQRHRMLKPRC